MIDHNDCRRLLNSLSDFVDGSLPPDLCSELEKHLQSCENCRIVVNTMRKTIELYQVSSEDGKVPADVRKRLYTRLNLDDFLKS
jgi:anti-sigma factor (TIGR02949 family)